MTLDELLLLMRAERHGVVASTSDAGAPQAAVVGLVVSDDLEIFFDTLDSTRKAANLRARPRAAVVLGSVAPDAQVTVQLEGVADEPRGATARYDAANDHYTLRSCSQGVWPQREQLITGYCGPCWNIVMGEEP